MPDAHEAAYAGWKRALVDKANANSARITSDFATVRAIVDGAPLVFGVFQDADEPDGVGLLLVKGHALLREIVASWKAWPVEMTAVPCACAEQAEALRQVAGEADKLHRGERTMPTTYEPTALERHAALAVTEAVDYLHRAQSLLDVAERALLDEECQHALYVGIGNQAKLVTFAEVAVELDRLRERLAP